MSSSSSLKGSASPSEKFQPTSHTNYHHDQHVKLNSHCSSLAVSICLYICSQLLAENACYNISSEDCHCSHLALAPAGKAIANHLLFLCISLPGVSMTLLIAQNNIFAYDRKSTDDAMPESKRFFSMDTLKDLTKSVAL